jgi:23S rRNA (pseudouridine1915-N3)-methyltransferase
VELRLRAIGRSRDPALLALTARYRQRCPWTIAIEEMQLRGAVPPARRPDAEAALLLADLPGQAVVVALDEHGRSMTSEALAQRLGRWRDEARSPVLFLIGGPDGHGTAALERADLVLALGPMTWPHELVRVLLIEQLYRAATILAGHPYHRV